MSLSIADYPDRQDAPGAVIPAAYAWISEVVISYSDMTARFTVWVHRSAAAAATWPSGSRVASADRLAIYCGSEVVGYPGVVFPSLATVLGRATTLAAAQMAEAETPEAEAVVLASVATGGAIRASLYAYLIELVFLDATEAE